MEKTVIKCGDTEIHKKNFTNTKDLKEIQILIKQQYLIWPLLVEKGFKYFISYKESKKIMPLCIFLPKMSAYRKDFDETKYVPFLIIDDKLLEKYNELQEKLKNSFKKEFDNERVYKKKYLKAKIKSGNGKIKTNSHDSKIPKERSQFIFLSVILVDSVIKTGENFSLQVFLEECKYVIKEKKIPKYIIDDVEFSSNSNEENSDEEILEKLQTEKNSEENSNDEN